MGGVGEFVSGFGVAGECVDGEYSGGVVGGSGEVVDSRVAEQPIGGDDSSKFGVIGYVRM